MFAHILYRRYGLLLFPLRVTTGEAMWERGRRVTLVGGALEEVFDPQAVHVYRFACQ